MPGVEPLLVGLLGGELGLDLLVGDDAALGGVDQEHAARAAGAPCCTTWSTGRGRARRPRRPCTTRPSSVTQIAAGAQAVAVEHGADDGAVGEAHRRRAVPRLHQRGVVLVEGPPGRVHRVVVLPRLGDHHQHGVGQRAAAEVQQLEHLVEAAVSRRPGGADREDLVEVAGERASLASSASRARIQFSLPVTVLISPLWATYRNGWASGHDGNVLVENRECTRARALSTRSSCRSG